MLVFVLCTVIFILCVLTTSSDALTVSLYVLVVSFKVTVMMGRACVGSHECCFSSRLLLWIEKRPSCLRRKLCLGPCKHLVGLVGDGKWRCMRKEPQRDKQLSSWLWLKVLKNMFGEWTANIIVTAGHFGAVQSQQQLKAGGTCTSTSYGGLQLGTCMYLLVFSVIGSLASHAIIAEQVH